MQSESQMGPESDYTSENKVHASVDRDNAWTNDGCLKSEEWSVRYSAAASIEFMAFVTTLLLGLAVVIVVMHIL
jgi:hypothetical protein